MLEITALMNNSHVESVCPTGSYFMCMPPIKDTDIDYALLPKEGEYYEAIETFRAWGFTLSSQGEVEYNFETDRFNCMRMGRINLIIIEERDFFDKWVIASALSTKLNLTSKEQRITLFRYFLYGEC